MRTSASALGSSAANRSPLAASLTMKLVIAGRASKEQVPFAFHVNLTNDGGQLLRSIRPRPRRVRIIPMA